MNRTKAAFIGPWVIVATLVAAETSPSPVASPVSAAPKVPASPMPEVSIDLDSPTGVIQKYTAELKTIIDPSNRKEKGKRNAEQEGILAAKVRKFFDFQTLAQMSLGHHWTKITKAQREEYTKIFVDLVEDNYLRRSRDLMGDYAIAYQKEEVKGNHAKVVSKIAQKDADITITYELHRNPNQWMIYNIILDDVDLVRNYQTQFNSIIVKYGFSSLISRMKNKLGAADDITL